jgi:hypothetical protein
MFRHAQPLQMPQERSLPTHLSGRAFKSGHFNRAPVSGYLKSNNFGKSYVVTGRRTIFAASVIAAFFSLFLCFFPKRFVRV